MWLHLNQYLCACFSLLIRSSGASILNERSPTSSKVFQTVSLCFISPILICEPIWGLPSDCYILAGATAMRKGDEASIHISLWFGNYIGLKRGWEREGKRQASRLTISGKRGQFTIQYAHRGIKCGPRKETRVTRKYSALEKLLLGKTVKQAGNEPVAALCGCGTWEWKGQSDAMETGKLSDYPSVLKAMAA